MATTPPYTTGVTIIVADEFMARIIGRPIYCSHFRLDQRKDGFYELTVTTGKGDADLQRFSEELGS